MLVIILAIKWTNLVMFDFVPNKLIALFLKVIIMQVIFLDSYIVIFGVPIVFHQPVGHIIFCQLLMMLLEQYGFI